MTSIFITGTDTNIGKTFITTLLLKDFNGKGYKTFAIKPVASGCNYNEINKYLENEDALILQKHASVSRCYANVNPIALAEPIAPHIAAEKMNFKLTTERVLHHLLSAYQKEADIHLIEGAGGWAVPLNAHQLYCDVICALNMPVILVVGVRLGCLNHAILTYQAIMQTKIPFIGWIANCIDPHMLEIKKNIHSLREWIKEPCLGVVPFACQQNVINTEYIEQFLFK